MDFQYFLNRIQLAPEGQEHFWSIHKRICEPAFARGFADCVAAYAAPDPEFAAQIKAFAEAQGLLPEVWNLYVYIRLAENTLADYRAKGIDDDIFYATMFDLTVCCRVCQTQCGIYGIPQIIYRHWCRMVLKGKIFRLGRLEFELYESGVDASIGDRQLKKGDPCINVHIPRYLPLDEEACEAAYDQARDFFARFFGMDDCVFLCHSWLLHPWMREVLPERSRILRFQNHFQLLEATQDPAGAAGWIFPNCEDKDLSEYPAETSLQRAALERIRSGGAIGLGRGIRL